MTTTQTATSPATKRLLITSALPYANGAIHLGHLVEYIQTDIWVRHQKMLGHEAYYVCADDTHGTPIMLRAEKEGITPQALIARVATEHQRDFASFHVNFDQYHSTDSIENKTFAEQIYRSLQAAGLIEVRSVEQYFDPIKTMFLPDRFIKGQCPKCGAADQYGDSCERCGATYSPTDLVNAYSTVSGATPIRKSSDHYFFKLSDPHCREFLATWTQQASRLQPEAANKMQEWFGDSDADGAGAGLGDWDISRDAPYFGFEIPDAPGKYFYVWLDAPVGYFASFKHLCDRIGVDINSFIQREGNEDKTTDGQPITEMVHFIGKDILYFHALFWPAMLKFSGHRTPTRIFAHGFLTVDGQKMSKSRGTFITAESYVQQQLNPEWLRYYFAAKLNASMEDIDLNFDDFIARVNSDLVGKLINIASRTAGFIQQRFAGRVLDVATIVASTPILQQLLDAAPAIQALYEAREYSKAMRSIMELADGVNTYIAEQAPWALNKQANDDASVLPTLHQICSVCLESFRILVLYLKPVLPVVAQHVETMLATGTQTWADVSRHLSSATLIAPYQHLMQRVERKQIDALIAANTESLQATPA